MCIVAALALGPAGCGAWGAAGISDGGGTDASVLVLRHHVVIRGAVVRLQDLLPEGTESALAQAAAEFVVARSPDLGTVLRLDRDRLALRLAGDARFRRFELPPAVLVVRSGYRLQRETIVRAIQSFLERQQIAPLTPAAAEALQWPQELASIRENPELEVAGVYPEHGGTTLRLRCVVPAACPPFLVTAPEMPGLPPAGFARMSGTKRTAKSEEKSSPLVFAGRPARLVLERDGMRISISVTCLDRGALRQLVRARERESGRIFRARVAGPALLEARF